MEEERLNPYFDINAKYEDMVLRAKSIVEHHLLVSDGDGEAPDYICLAYDVKNYLPKLQQENQRLKDRIGKAIEYIEKDYKFANYDIPLLTKDEQLAGKLLEILKGDNND